MRRSGPREDAELAAVRDALAADAADELSPLRPVWPRIRDEVARRGSAPVRRRWSVALGACAAAVAGVLLGVWVGLGLETVSTESVAWTGTDVGVVVSDEVEPTLCDIYFALVSDEGSESP